MYFVYFVNMKVSMIIRNWNIAAVEQQELLTA